MSCGSSLISKRTSTSGGQEFITEGTRKAHVTMSCGTNLRDSYQRWSVYGELYNVRNNHSLGRELAKGYFVYFRQLIALTH